MASYGVAASSDISVKSWIYNESVVGPACGYLGWPPVVGLTSQAAGVESHSDGWPVETGNVLTSVPVPQGSYEH